MARVCVKCSVSDLSHFDVDPDPDTFGKSIRVPIFHIFHIEIHVGQIEMLIYYCQNLEKAFLR